MHLYHWISNNPDINLGDLYQGWATQLMSGAIHWQTQITCGCKYYSSKISKNKRINWIKLVKKVSKNPGTASGSGEARCLPLIYMIMRHFQQIKISSVVAFLARHFLTKYAKNDDFSTKWLLSNRTWCSVHIQLALFRYVFDNNWYKDFPLIKDTPVTKFQKKNFFNLIFWF